ncbi:M1 family metallopeptidase [Mesonia aestuariivivens]|uniref:M1 family metallopeptidase n=1 Tax=Mesonia aestuariivivens TaxID=2796128 RepID=A0ABS6W5A8_9FLAO|nr:M1 family metallopeptidase [Mesonia aestuariivivens]MBW2963048.1 M1 family metallopeptidase [Mesonia aestuariivivens]
MKSLLGLVLVTFGAMSVFAQDAKENNQSLFDDFMYRSGNVYRSASGKPGPEYWQNKADYKLKVELHPETHTVTGEVEIKYYNNSPEKLDFIWLYVEQNRFTDNSRGTLTTPTAGNRYNGDTSGGYALSEVEVDGDQAEYLITDTRMKIFLDDAVKEDGGKAKISMKFSYKIPVDGMDRMGRLDVEQGWIYAMAQWYPRVAVFDDVTGWNVEPYLGAGEFYLEYGDYDYEVTVPYNYTVVGSGDLQNPKDVLTKTQLNRWKKAKETEETTYIIKPEEVGTAQAYNKTSGKNTWHFKMENTHDVAFGASNAFIWDAARINLEDDRKALAQSAYPKESDGQKAWSRSTEYTKASIEFYSENYYPYPYKNAVNVAAEIGGMEYPGLSFCSWRSKEASLWGVTDHEFGHNWFPMIVGSNERKFAWMDEGFNTFINHFSSNEFNDSEYPSTLDQTRSIVPYLKKETREGIDTYPDVTNLRNLGYTAYYKPAVGLITLRNYILGPKRFDQAFKSYIKTWAFKHPQPADFFNHIENSVGENLNWFWKGWFYGTENIDIAVSDVEKTENGFLIHLSKEGEIPMPVKLKVTYTDGTATAVNLPVEIWQRGNKWEHFLPTNKEVEKVEFDAEKQVPDIHSSNDVWKKKN